MDRCAGLRGILKNGPGVGAGEYLLQEHRSYDYLEKTCSPSGAANFPAVSNSPDEQREEAMNCDTMIELRWIVLLARCKC